MLGRGGDGAPTATALTAAAADGAGGLLALLLKDGSAFGRLADRWQSVQRTHSVEPGETAQCQLQ